MNKYDLIQTAREAYTSGKNITEALRTALDHDTNTNEIIELAYHLQAGSYSDKALNHPCEFDQYCDDIALLLEGISPLPRSVLDIGTGEMTIFSGICKRTFTDPCELFAMDLSLKRLLAGQVFLKTTKSTSRIQPITGNFFELPFSDKSIDLVISTHAIEPNGGQEAEAVAEVFRVAKQYALFIEPSYRHNSDEGRSRMKRLGYIKELGNAIRTCGGTIEVERKINSESYLQQPLNPTWGYLCTPPLDMSPPAASSSTLACPISKKPLERQADHYHCPESGLAYPIIEGIPILRSDYAVLKT